MQEDMVHGGSAMCWCMHVWCPRWCVRGAWLVLVVVMISLAYVTKTQIFNVDQVPY